MSIVCAQRTCSGLRDVLIRARACGQGAVVAGYAWRAVQVVYSSRRRATGWLSLTASAGERGLDERGVR
jgi:hypothetical protein